MLQSIEGDKGPAPPYPVLRGFLADFMLPTKTIRSLKLSTECFVVEVLRS